MKVLLLNGPNLNLLGIRQPEIYGTTTLLEITNAVSAKLNASGKILESFQSNSEGALIDKIHESVDKISGLIINPAGLSHTSVSLRDALSCLSCPKVEVHISNIYSREDFRHHSYISPVVNCVISGAGVLGYQLAADYLIAI